MNRIIITSVVVSKGYQEQPALRFSDKSDSTRSVRFKVGERLYDKRAGNNNTRYINHGVKAFGNLADRIEKMGVKEGSYVNIIGRLDEDAWDDNGTTKRMPVIILDDIEFCYSGKKQDDARPAPAASSSENPAEGGGFGGYSPFGGENMLY